LQFTYKKAAMFCCTYGLEVASFETLAEQKCVFTEAKSKKNLGFCANYVSGKNSMN
jgi:hypothetical protein